MTSIKRHNTKLVIGLAVLQSATDHC